MGLFKKFGQKATALGRFGVKGAKAVAFGAKKVAHGATHLGKAVSTVATIGAGLATALGQPELAAPLVGIAQGAARISERGQRAQKAISDVRQAKREAQQSLGLQKTSKKSNGSPFESGAPAQAPAEPQAPAIAFESTPHHRRKGHRY